MGLAEGTPITYRAGDQPNNVLSLGVLNPGEIASTAGTSGVVYGVNGTVNYDPQSRVNTFCFAYTLYGVICVVAALFVWRLVPEIKGKTLEDMTRLWKKES